MQTTESSPLKIFSGPSRLFQDFCADAAAARRFYASPAAADGWRRRPTRPAHWAEMVDLLAAQNPQAGAENSLAALRQGAGVMVTGQQVGLFGGPLYSPLKAATAVARARQATAAGEPAAPIFWLASEDHDFAEINHVVLPAKRELRKLVYSSQPAAPVPVGGLALDEAILPLIDELEALLGPSAATAALAANYKPGRTLAEAFAGFYAEAFAAQGLLLFDPSGREAHRLGAPVLRAAIEQADELHAALVGRGEALAAAGYHTQVATPPGSSLLFLIDAATGARMALKRQPATVAEPHGLWRAGGHKYSNDELLGVLAAEPERISPTALLRPVFQDFLFGSSAIIGGPAEIAYFAQSAVVYERILGRQTPPLPRFSATLVEPGIAELLAKHDLPLERIFSENEDSLAQLLAGRALPSQGRERLASAGEALEGELAGLLKWMQTLDAGLGRSAATSANKMRYQMGRLRRLAANFQLQRDARLGREAAQLARSLYPGGVLQERVVGAAYFFAEHGFALSETLAEQAANRHSAHAAIWL